MKKKILLSMWTLMLLVNVGEAQVRDTANSSSWKRYTVKGKEFSVELPTLPAMHLSNRFVKVSEKPRQEMMVGSYADGVAYVVYALENPYPQLPLEGFIAEQTGGDRWNSATERNVTCDGLSGKVFTSVNPSDGMIQFFAGEDRLYKFFAFGAPAEDPRISRFFSSVSFKTRNAVEVSEGPGLPFEPSAQPQPAAGESVNKVFGGRDVDRKIRLAMKPDPSYTEEARQNQITGTVVLKCVFKSDGSVQNITIVSGLPYGLTEKSIEAARRIKFIPAMKDGKYVSMWIQLEYNFNLY